MSLTMLEQQGRDDAKKAKTMLVAGWVQRLAAKEYEAYINGFEFGWNNATR